MHEQVRMRKLQDASVFEEVHKAIAEELKPLETSKLLVEGTWQTYRIYYLKHLKGSVGQGRTGEVWARQQPGGTTQWKRPLMSRKAVHRMGKITTGWQLYKIFNTKWSLQKSSKTAKYTFWKKYGEELSKLCKKLIREFHRSIKAMMLWDEPFSPTTTINDNQGKPHVWWWKNQMKMGEVL